MNLKKFTAAVLVSALSLASSVSVFAKDYVVPTENGVDVEIVVTKYTDDEVADFGLELGDNEGYYNITVNVGLTDEGAYLERYTTKEGRNTYNSGYGLTSAEVLMYAEDGKKLSLDFDNSDIPSKDGNASTEYGIQCFYNGVSATGFLPANVASNVTSLDGIFNIDVIATNNSKVTCKPTFSFREFASDKIVEGKTATLYLDEQVITLGSEEPEEPGEPEEPEITINDKYVFNFTAEEGQDVMVTLKRKNGITSDLTYALPENVKGTASVFGLLNVVDDTVVSGDIFDIAVVDANRNVVRDITTIPVE